MTAIGVPTIKVTEGIASLNGLTFFGGGLTELKERVRSLIGDGRVHLVVTTNTDQIIDIGKSASLGDAYRKASLRLVDGKPLQTLIWAMGGHTTQRITGADLLPTVADWSRQEGWRIAIVGGAGAVGERAAHNLRNMYPGSRVEHIPFPYTADVRNSVAQTVAKHLHGYQPDISFVCLGSPKQEDWVIGNMAILPSGVYVGAGAAVDFAAGAKSRAPDLVQKAGLEWTWRLVQEPGRLWHRYLVKGPAFIPVIFRSIRGNLK